MLWLFLTFLTIIVVVAFLYILKTKQVLAASSVLPDQPKEPTPPSVKLPGWTTQTEQADAKTPPWASFPKPPSCAVSLEPDEKAPPHAREQETKAKETASPKAAEKEAAKEKEPREPVKEAPKAAEKEKEALREPVKEAPKGAEKEKEPREPAKEAPKAKEDATPELVREEKLVQRLLECAKAGVFLSENCAGSLCPDLERRGWKGLYVHEDPQILREGGKNASLVVGDISSLDLFALCSSRNFTSVDYLECRGLHCASILASLRKSPTVISLDTEEKDVQSPPGYAFAFHSEDGRAVYLLT